MAVEDDGSPGRWLDAKSMNEEACYPTATGVARSYASEMSMSSYCVRDEAGEADTCV